MKKNLIVLAHPNLLQSKVNKKLAESAATLPSAEIIDLYKRYGDIKFDTHLPEDKLEEDRRKMEGAEKIILQFPFYWYSSPSLLKQWLDDVLKFGWCHHGGVEGEKYALAEKELALAIVCGGNNLSYTPTGYNNSHLTSYLDPFVQTARTLKMKMNHPFAIYGSLKISETDLDSKAKEYIKFISG